MKKKWYGLSIISSILLAACGNGTSTDTGEGTDVVTEDDMDETVQLTAYGVKAPSATSDWDEMEWFNQFADNVNVEIDWTNGTDQTATETVNLMFASDDLPDMFYSAWTFGASDLVKYGSLGQLIPLNDLIEEHAPNIKAFLDSRPEVVGSISTPDGNIYALPQYAENPANGVPDVLFINTDWLEQVGMEMPNTTDEFKEVLMAFRDADLNGNGDSSDEIPFSFVLDNQNRAPHSLSGSFGVTGRFIGIEDGELFYAPTRDEYKDYLGWMHDLYSEGLIDPEAFTHDFSIYDSKVRSSTPIVGAYIAWSLTDDYGTTDVGYEAVPPMAGPDGHKGWNSLGTAMSQSGFSITHQNENPIRTIKWVDQLYEPETSIEVAFGPIGVNIEKTADGNYEYIETPEGMGYEEFRHLETPGGYGAYGILEENFQKMEQSDGDLEKLSYTQMYSEVTPEEVFPMVMYSEEDSDRIAVLDSDIQDFTYQMIANAVINGITDESWEASVNQLDQLGLGEMLEIQQRYYDNYLEAQK